MRDSKHNKYTNNKNNKSDPNNKRRTNNYEYTKHDKQ